ncbi:hypothetical protein [Pararhodonellum marinum]|uniref:hypothetical protein n=1 Tax=Pararhodonellum marinum TaxID=2755358 RepID=UPI0018902C5A|nr:hypothetical protein [Pararhodonellum marinum]
MRCNCKMWPDISSKGKDKSGGARVITYTKIVESFVYLLAIYSRWKKENISKKELQKLLLNLR